MAPHQHPVLGALVPLYLVSLQPQTQRQILSNALDINTLTLTYSLSLWLTLIHTHIAQFSLQMAPGRATHWMANDKFCSIFSVREIWCPILMTHLIYSHCKLATRLQMWNELIFQSSAWYNSTQNNGKVICVALISEVHTQENTIVCLN